METPFSISLRAIRRAIPFVVGLVEQASVYANLFLCVFVLAAEA